MTNDQHYRIAVYPGDGIGPEVIDEAVRVLRAVEATSPAVRFDLTSFPWGVEYRRQHGRVVPADFLSVLRPFDAILLGAVGWPAELPDHETLAPLVSIRQSFDQYACVRPAKLLPGVACPLANKGPAEVDFVVIRENSEGEYVDNGGRFRRGTPEECATQTALHTRRGVERILRYGFELARGRRSQLTMATKSNAQRFAYAMMNLVRWPERFDVIVASNLFGDLLTDLGGVLAGGLGLAPSTNTNPERRFPSMFEPVHGSAPDIAGRGVANPIAAILSAAMMLDHLGCGSEARRIERAVADCLAADSKTRDLGGTLSTRDMGEAIAARLAGGGQSK
jgi:tartrate dehydrogenase/decarboxylase/D-malate dehydrogenase